MKYVSRGLAVVATAFLSVLSAAAGSVAQEKAQLNVALAAQPPGLDSHIITVGITNELTRTIFETLVTLDADLQIKPALAKDWSVSEDGMTYTFQLRPGVKFHDGSTLQASDVVASMERWSRLSNPGKVAFSNAKWEAQGTDKVVLTVPAASYRILFSLANEFNQPATIMPAAIIQAAGDEPVKQTIGTGPYKLTEWVADQSLTLEKFADYTPFEGEASGWAGNRTPLIDTLKFIFTSDDSTRMLGLETGEFDLVPDTPSDAVEEVAENAELKMASYPQVKLFLIGNKANGIFTNLAARKAVDLSLDREEILYAAGAREDLFFMNHHLMFKDQESVWNTDVGREGFNTKDIETAKKNLSEAGYKGEELVMITSSDYSDIYNAAIIIQQQLKEAGLNVRLETYDWPTFVERRSKKEGWDLMVINNTYKVDPTHWLHLSKNYAGFTDDPKLDDILGRFETAKDFSEARTLYDELMTWHNAYIPASIIGETDNVVSYGKRIDTLPIMSGPVYWGIKLAAQ